MKIDKNKIYCKESERVVLASIWRHIIDAEDSTGEEHKLIAQLSIDDFKGFLNAKSFFVISEIAKKHTEGSLCEEYKSIYCAKYPNGMDFDLFWLNLFKRVEFTTDEELENVQCYIDIIRERSTLRQLVDAAEELAKEGRQEDIDKAIKLMNLDGETTKKVDHEK